MAKMARSARGEIVDFDLIRIKQALAEAPQNIEVQRRKNFIDNKEGVKDNWVKQEQPAPPVVSLEPKTSSSTDFEELGDPVPAPRVEPPAPAPIKRAKQ